eukprot:jgi/Ulvmu1/800/UM010_0174.1
MRRQAAFSGPKAWSRAGYGCASRTAVLPKTAQVPAVSASKENDPEARNVAIFVEPSPFSHISGMKNRFECLIRNLKDQGDDVIVFTPDRSPPKEYCGAKVVDVLGFKLPFYQAPTLLLSLGLSVRVMWYLLRKRPDVIHVSSPGLLVFSAVLYSKLLSIPLVISYHTHIPEYIPRYTWSGLVAPMWSIIRWCTKMSDLTLVTSKAMKQELSDHNCKKCRLEVWQRGVDTDQFNPRFRCDEMRARMTGGHPEAPLLIHVGRLGAEKNLFVLKDMMAKLPGARLAFVGDGPSRQQLQEHFADMPEVKFMGMMKGEDLSKAYASGDVFVMPSESETLGFVVLEAMASRVPVVAVAAGGLTDIITAPGTNGLLYPPGDYDSAVEQIRGLIEDGAHAEAIARGGREEVERWGWGAATRRLRRTQYGRAIRNKLAHKRFGLLALRAALWRLIRLPGVLFAALVALVVDLLDYASPLRAQTV